MFGTPGPDPGWAVKLVAKAKLPDDDPRLRDVVTGLVIARAAAFGRAAVKEDIDAALVLCGYGDESRPELAERRRRWLAATAHDSRLGATAVAEIDPHVITAKPEQIRYAHRLQERSGRESEPEASGDAG
jgi:hypothetical protein